MNYFQHGEGDPLFALSTYAKNQRDDISDAERNAFRRLTKSADRDAWKGKAMSKEIARRRGNPIDGGVHGLP